MVGGGGVWRWRCVRGVCRSVAGDLTTADSGELGVACARTAAPSASH